MNLLRRLFIAILITQTLLLGGTLGYRFIEGWPLLESLYMTVITITTVGYGEVHQLSREGRIFTVFLIMSSFGVMAYIVGSITQTIIAGQLRKILGRRKLEKRIKRQKDHFILCGYGRIGSFIAREFKREDVPFVIVENDPERIKLIEEDEFPYVEGDADEDEILVRAGIERARGLIAAVRSDADNLYITLSARSLNPNLYILSRANEEGADRKLLSAGANRVVSPYLMGAARMVNAVLRPNIVEFVDLVVRRRHLELQLEEITVEDDARFKGKPLGESGIRRDLGLIVVAIKKQLGKMIFNPSSETLIEKGDILIVLGEKKHLEMLEQLVKSAEMFGERV
ncbi:MAG: potassium channel protein [Deltaproteobacteria bacterium]|nr:potassium channel protein [Deltaproteobacteria bacterium]